MEIKINEDGISNITIESSSYRKVVERFSGKIIHNKIGEVSFEIFKPSDAENDFYQANMSNSNNEVIWSSQYYFRGASYPVAWEDISTEEILIDTTELDGSLSIFEKIIAHSHNANQEKNGGN